MDKENIAYTLNDEPISGDFKLDELLSSFESNSFSSSSSLVNDETYAEISNYDLNYTMKQLAIICNYYNIISNRKNWKKMDYIKNIVEFENTLENYETVIRRKQMWFYMDELKHDKFMKQFILFV
jgi:hypothetical protein